MFYLRVKLSSFTARIALVIFYNKHNIYFNMIYSNNIVSDASHFSVDNGWKKLTETLK